MVFRQARWGKEVRAEGQIAVLLRVVRESLAEGRDLTGTRDGRHADQDIHPT